MVWRWLDRLLSCFKPHCRWRDTQVLLDRHGFQLDDAIKAFQEVEETRFQVKAQACMFNIFSCRHGEGGNFFFLWDRNANDLGHQTFSLFMVLFENLQVFRAHGLLHDDRFLELWIVWMKCEKERWVSILRIFCSYPFSFLLLFISLPLEKVFFITWNLHQMFSNLLWVLKYFIRRATCVCVDHLKCTCIGFF